MTMPEETDRATISFLIIKKTAIALAFGFYLIKALPRLVTEWSNNANSEGVIIFLPVAVLLLISTARQSRTLTAKLEKQQSISKKLFLPVLGFLFVLFAALDALLNEVFFLALGTIIATALYIFLSKGKNELFKLAFPFMLLLFSLPLPQALSSTFIHIHLQRASTKLADVLLTLWGTEVFNTGTILNLKNGMLNVEEACSGFKNLAAMIFLVLICGRIFLKKHIWLRIAAVGGAVVVALAGNALRLALAGLIQNSSDHTEALRFMHGWQAQTIFILLSLGMVGCCWLAGKFSETKWDAKQRTQKSNNPSENKASSNAESIPSELSWPRLLPVIALFLLGSFVPAYFHNHLLITEGKGLDSIPKNILNWHGSPGHYTQKQDLLHNRLEPLCDDVLLRNYSMPGGTTIEAQVFYCSSRRPGNRLVYYLDFVNCLHGHYTGVQESKVKITDNFTVSSLLLTLRGSDDSYVISWLQSPGKISSSWLQHGLWLYGRDLLGKRSDGCFVKLALYGNTDEKSKRELYKFSIAFASELQKWLQTRQAKRIRLYDDDPPKTE